MLLLVFNESLTKMSKTLHRITIFQNTYDRGHNEYVTAITMHVV